jgi:hypothetical protein
MFVSIPVFPIFTSCEVMNTWDFLESSLQVFPSNLTGFHVIVHFDQTRQRRLMSEFMGALAVAATWLEHCIKSVRGSFCTGRSATRMADWKTGVSL